MRCISKIAKIIAYIAFLISSAQINAAEISIAVAANFFAPLQKIASAFEQDTGNKVTISVGSTGKIYTQIKNGAPFQVFLSADQDTPSRLEQEGLTVMGSRMTYAVGKLVLWSKRANFVDDKGEVLKSGQFDHFAVADPKLAPYGAAALQVIEKLGLQGKLNPKAVWGENISQTYLFVDSQAVALGFVALSQVIKDGRVGEGSVWMIPTSLYSSIKQDAVLLSSAKGNPVAEAFLRYLRSKKAQEIIESYGYGF